MARAAQAVAWVRQGHPLPDDITTLGARNIRWPDRSRAAVRDMTFRAVREMGRCQTILRSLNKRPPHDAVMALQIVALEQLINPLRDTHTIVDQAVQAARERRATRGATGLINAVLRRFLRERDALLTEATKDPVAQFNFPMWWIDCLRSEQPRYWESILRTSNQSAPMTLRVNNKKISTSDYLAKLKEQKIDAHVIGPSAIALKVARDVHSLPGFDGGLASVQDAGAQLAAALLDVSDGQAVLDACAAPGGKSAHLLELASLKLVSMDKDAHRLKRVAQNLKRLGLSPNAELIAADAADPQSWPAPLRAQRFDRILVDAPCTASGIVRRHPESRWLRRRRDIETLASQQLKILNGLWPALKPGGKLLYATCSVFSAEGVGVIDRFVESTDSARRLPISAAVGGALRVEPIDQLLPVADGQKNHDGFFYALIERVT
jgi:16S rRNA (cytosine967-C5)-methyltransferase